MSDKGAFQGSSLCAVGNINRDVKTAPFYPGEDPFSDGETSVSSIAETIGGCAANSAVAAAALGARVTLAGKVGNDGLGRRLERTLIRHGVETHLFRDESRPTGTSIALTYEGGHRHFFSCLPASESLSFADIDLSVLKGHTHLLRADLWFSESMLHEGNRLLLQHARQLGLATSLDLNWDPQWGSTNAEKIRARKKAVGDVLPWVNLAHGNVRELMQLTDAADLDTALKRLTDWGVEAVVVHMGKEGAGYYCNGALVVEPPLPVKSHVNTTGTGDVLSVCMMLLHGRDDIEIPERLRLANAVVAQFIEGRLSLIPSLEE